MIFEGKQYPATTYNYNAILKDCTRDMEDMEARLALAQFLRHNLGFTLHLLSGVELLPLQEVILKGLFIKDNALIVAGRGVGKSYMISAFCALFPIFNPSSKLCLISSNFRGAKRLFDNVEKMVKNKNAELLMQCFANEPKRGNDIVRWSMPGDREIFALPLSNGDGLRGTRASAVLVDEGLLISREIQQIIIRPFLTARQDYQEEKEIRKIEDAMIAKGMMKEEERISFPSNKYLVFSSASYKFQYLYEMFSQYTNTVLNTEKEPIKDKKAPTYFVVQASYESLPDESFMDKTAIEGAKADGGENTEYFRREYKAQFSDGNDGYFDVKKLHECTIPDLQEPTVQIKGDSAAKYILSIDPAYGANKSNDYFAMAVYMLIPEKREMVLVHTYGRAGADIIEQYKYLNYLLTYFNIVYVIIDGSGTEFIDSYNNSTIAAEKQINLGYITADLNSDDYLKEIHEAQKQYNLNNRRIVYPQVFTSDTKRRMNEFLQGGIASKKVWFASRICASDTAYTKALHTTLPYIFKDKDDKDMTVSDMLADQDMWIQQTKDQLSLIEVRASALGTLTYDLPQSMKRDESPNRPRRDHYTCCFMAYYAAKHYFDIMYTEPQKIVSTFDPYWI